MTPQVFLKAIVEPGGRMQPWCDSAEARCLLLAIACQESGLQERLQQPVAFARGFWQCERGGAVLEVLTRDATRERIWSICDALCIPRGLDQVTEAIAWNDALAYCLARLNLWLDEAPLPPIGACDAAWAVYARVWAPGKRDPDRWVASYTAAAACFAGPTPVVAA